jgi:acyl-CoA thioester hydrolase
MLPGPAGSRRAWHLGSNDERTISRVTLARPSNRKPPFKYAAYTRVGFSDTDAQGVVYYGRYLPYFDMARVEYHRHLDTLVERPYEDEFVLRACTIEYFAPARFDDLLEVFVRVARIGRTSIAYEAAAYRVDDDMVMVTAQQALVLVDLAERKPRRIPDWLRDRIRAFEGEDVEVAALSAAGEER